MKDITAQLNNYRQSPRKVRVVADTIRGKSVKEAKICLNFITKRATNPLFKLLNSAIANAKNLGLNEETLKIKEIKVDGGKILYRRRPVSHGAAHPIHKRTSHITVVLVEKAQVEKGASKNKKQK